MDKKLNFTKTSLERLSLPLAGRRTWMDTPINGLQLIVTSSGTKSFYVRRKVHGRSERFYIGRFPDVTVEQARRKGQEILGQVATGRNPEEIRGHRRANTTLGAVFIVYLDQHAKQHKKSWKEDQAQFNRYLTKWQTRQLKTITRADVSKLHAEIGRDHGLYAANRALSLLHTMFRFAIGLGIHKGENPASGIRKFKEEERKRFLRPDELPAFVNAVEQEPNETARDFVWLALMTGQRMSNVLSMRWNDIDLTREEWHIPITKNGTSITVPLPRQAVVILKRRSLNFANNSTYVLPSSGRSGHMTQPKKAWERITKAAKTEDFRIHDLRHTLASWQTCTGASLVVIGATLNHKTAAATKSMPIFIQIQCVVQ